MTPPKPAAIDWDELSEAIGPLLADAKWCATHHEFHHKDGPCPECVEDAQALARDVSYGEMLRALTLAIARLDAVAEARCDKGTVVNTIALIGPVLARAKAARGY